MTLLLRKRLAIPLIAAFCSLPLHASAQETPSLEPETTRSGAKAGAGSAPAAEEGSETRARELVERADEVRFPKQAFQVEVTVRSRSGDEELLPRVYRVSSKGNENTIVQTLEPAVERGQNMLMRGRDLWIFLPSVSQPVRLSLSQRLTGQVANGDLARANFSGDYTPTIVGSEKIDGVAYTVLDLAAAQRGVTYPKVKYWVRASDAHPLKAEFYSVSGRLLKTCTYEDYKPLGGRTRPTKLVMTDALKAGDVSVLTYSELKLVDLPDRFFTKDYMKRLD